MCYHKRNRSTTSTKLCRAHNYACIPALPTSTYTMNTCHAQMAAADRTNRLYLSYDKKFTGISSYVALCTASCTCPIHYQTGRQCQPNYAQSHFPRSGYYHKLVPPLASTSVCPRRSSEMAYVLECWAPNDQITRDTIVRVMG